MTRLSNYTMDNVSNPADRVCVRASERPAMTFAALSGAADDAGVGARDLLLWSVATEDDHDADACRNRFSYTSLPTICIGVSQWTLYRNPL